MGKSVLKWGKIIYFYTVNQNLSNMSSFIGEYTCKVDAKGRLSFPSAFKRQLDEKAQNRFVVKTDIFENCLILYSYDEWESQVNRLRKKINPYKREHNKFLRRFFKGTAEVVLDSNNRLLIPKKLMEIITHGKEVVFFGQDGKIEIWDKVKYMQLENSDDDFANSAEKIMNDFLD